MLRGHLDPETTDTHTGKTTRRHRGTLTYKPRNIWGHQKRFSLEPAEGINPDDILISDMWPQNCDITNFCATQWVMTAPRNENEHDHYWTSLSVSFLLKQDSITRHLPLLPHAWQEKQNAHVTWICFVWTDSPDWMTNLTCFHSNCTRVQLFVFRPPLTSAPFLLFALLIVNLQAPL